MDTEIIAVTWRTLGKRQSRFVADFYDLLFVRHPRYRRLFPREIGHAHLDKMVQAVALLAELADDETDIAPHLRKLAKAHRSHALQPGDYDNFRSAFVAALGEALGAAWSAEAKRGWEAAFDEVLIPAMMEAATA